MTDQVEYKVLVKRGDMLECVIIFGLDFNHALSEALDEFGGWQNVLGVWPNRPAAEVVAQ